MIAVDATPLVVDPRRGVARALSMRLLGWAQEPPEDGVVLLAPRPLDEDLPFEVRTPRRPTGSAFLFRLRLPDLLGDVGATVLYSPFAAFPRTRVPVVVTVHELPFVRLGRAAEGRVREHRHRRWLRRDVGAAAGVVVPSTATRDDVLALHPEAGDQVHVIPNGFDPAPWARNGRRPRGGAATSLVVVGTGHRSAGSWKKGLDVLLEALGDLPEAHVTVVGQLDGPVPAGVTVRPEVDDAELVHLVASATCLVHPARSEGFGYPPLEAMAAGTPVVTTDGGALPEIVGDAAVVVPAGDAAALADGVRRVLEGDAHRERLVAAGRRRLEDPALDPAEGARRLAAVLRAAEASS